MQMGEPFPAAQISSGFFSHFNETGKKQVHGVFSIY